MVHQISGTISMTQVSFAGCTYSPLYHSWIQAKEVMRDMGIRSEAEIPEIKPANNFTMIQNNGKDQRNRAKYQSNFHLVTDILPQMLQQNVYFLGFVTNST